MSEEHDCRLMEGGRRGDNFPSFRQYWPVPTIPIPILTLRFYGKGCKNLILLVGVNVDIGSGRLMDFYFQ